MGDNENDDADIYGDLPDFKYGETLEEYRQVISTLKETVIVLRERIICITKERDKLHEKCSVLSLNISSLLKTAKAEIARKNRTIDSLRKQTKPVYSPSANWARKRRLREEYTKKRRGQDSLSNHPPENREEAAPVNNLKLKGNVNKSARVDVEWNAPKNLKTLYSQRMLLKINSVKNPCETNTVASNNVGDIKPVVLDSYLGSEEKNADSPSTQISETCKAVKDSQPATCPTTLTTDKDKLHCDVSRNREDKENLSGFVASSKHSKLDTGNCDKILSSHSTSNVYQLRKLNDQRGRTFCRNSNGGIDKVCASDTKAVAPPKLGSKRLSSLISSRDTGKCVSATTNGGHSSSNGKGTDEKVPRVAANFPAPNRVVTHLERVLAKNEKIKMNSSKVIDPIRRVPSSTPVKITRANSGKLDEERKHVKLVIDLFGSPCPSDDDDDNNDAPKIDVSSPAVFEDSCSAQIDNNKFKGQSRISKGFPNQDQEITSTQVPETYKTPETESKNESAFIRKVEPKIPPKPNKSMFSPPKESRSSVFANQRESFDERYSFSGFPFKMVEDSYIGQFETTTQFVSSLTKVESKLSPLNTPVKNNDSRLPSSTMENSTPNFSCLVKTTPTMSIPKNIQETPQNKSPKQSPTTTVFTPTISSHSSDKPINILQPRKTPRIVNKSHGKGVISSSIRPNSIATKEPIPKPKVFAINDSFISEQERRVKHWFKDNVLLTKASMENEKNKVSEFQSSELPVSKEFGDKDCRDKELISTNVRKSDPVLTKDNTKKCCEFKKPVNLNHNRHEAPVMNTNVPGEDNVASRLSPSPNKSKTISNLIEKSRSINNFGPNTSCSSLSKQEKKKVSISPNTPPTRSKENKTPMKNLTEWVLKPIDVSPRISYGVQMRRSIAEKIASLTGLGSDKKEKMREKDKKSQKIIIPLNRRRTCFEKSTISLNKIIISKSRPINFGLSNF